MWIAQSLKKPLLVGIVWFLLAFDGKPALGAESPEETEKLQYTSWGLLYGWIDAREEQRDGANNEMDEYTAMLLSSLTYALRQEGYEFSFQEQLKESPVAIGSDLPETPRPILYGLERAQETRSRWLVVVRTYRERTRFIWSIGIYDGLSQTLVVSDSSFLFPGLSALPQLDETVGRILANWKKKQEEVVNPVEVVEQRQLFKRTQDGVMVYLGSPSQGIVIGTLQEPSLLAPYIPMGVGKPLSITLEKEGYWSKEVVLPKGITDRPFRLPALQKKTDQAWWAATTLARLMGAELGRRWYVMPDRFFFSLSDALWMNYTFQQGAYPVFHTEIRGEFGMYLQRAVDAPFRITMGMALGGIYTWIPAFADEIGRIDLVMDPLFIGLEYHFPTWAIFIKNRFPFALGTGYLDRALMEIPGMGPQFWSVGVLIK